MASDKDDADLENLGSDKASSQAIAYPASRRLLRPCSSSTLAPSWLRVPTFITRFHDDHAQTSDGRLAQAEASAARR
jgi:hypothetical protein